MVPNRKPKNTNKRISETSHRRNQSQQSQNRTKTLSNLELNGIKVQSVKGPLSIKELEYWIRTNYKGTLRSKRCERAYQRYLRSKPKWDNKRDNSIKIQRNNYPYNLKIGLEHLLMWNHRSWEGLIEFQKQYKKKAEEILNKKVHFAWISSEDTRTNPIPHIHLIIENDYFN